MAAEFLGHGRHIGTIAPMISQRSAWWSAQVAAVLFGMTGILGALIHANAWVVTLGRAAFAVLAIVVFAALMRVPLRTGITRAAAKVLGMSGLLLAVHWVTFFIAVKVGGVAVATLGFASFPAFIALIDAGYYRERIGLGEATRLLMVTAGLVLVTPSFNLADQGTTGLLWGLASGLSFGCLAVLNRRGAGQLTPVQVALWQNVVVAVLVAPVALWQAAMPSPADWVYMALLGVLCTGLAQYLFVRALGGMNARSVGMIIALEPVYAIAVAWPLFGEQPTPRMLGGAVLIVLATLLPSRHKSAA